MLKELCKAQVPTIPRNLYIIQFACHFYFLFHLILYFVNLGSLGSLLDGKSTLPLNPIDPKP